MPGPVCSIIELPEGTLLLDLSQGTAPPGYRFAIGRYNEKRPGIYVAELFGGVRNIHMGIDIFGPVGTPIRAFGDGKVLMRAYNAATGDYGYTLITEHLWEGETLYALWGHLSATSITDNSPGRSVRRGEIIAWIGDKAENGGWEPHLHFQLCRRKPEVCDMPGVVSEADHEEALRLYPDPRLVLGPLY